MPDVTNHNRAIVQIEPLLLRKEEAALVLGVSPRTFDDLVLANLIGKIRVGGSVRYDVEDLRAFVRQARQEHLTKNKIAALIEENKPKRQAQLYRAKPASSDNPDS
jgi:excisionase family DNA binding protein